MTMTTTTTTKKNPWQVQSAQPTGVTTDVRQAQPQPESEATGVENVRYDRVTAQGGPRVPRNGAQVAAEGLTKSAAELAKPDAVSDESNENHGSDVSSAGRQEQKPEYDFRGFDRQIAAIREAAARTAEETKEEREAREKRERSRKIVAAVSDGLNALGNLVWTTQYAPNMYEHKEQSQLEPLRRHYERMRQEREANRDKHLQWVLRLGDVENSRAAALRGVRAAQAAARVQAAKDARDEAKAEAERRRAEAQARWYDAKAEAEPVKAEAAKANKSVARGRSGGRGKPAEYPWYDRNGKLNWSHSYEAMRQNALREGTWIESTGTSVRTKYNSATEASETTTSPNKGRSAKPGGRKKKKNPIG